MAVCACGDVAEGGGTRCPRCAALQELGLDLNAAEAEIKSAYRAHVKAWHPDRFMDDKLQQQAAERKMKAVNYAFQFLTSPSSKKSRRPQTETSAPHNPPRQQAEKEHAPSSEKSQPAGERSKDRSNTQAPPRPPNYQTGGTEPRRHTRWNPSSSIRTFLLAAVGVCAAIVGTLFRQSSRPRSILTTGAPQPQQAQRASLPQYPSTIDPTATEQRAEGLYKLKLYSDARTLFKLACDGEQMRACNYLGYLYANGLGGARDLHLAHEVYESACDRGTLASCASLGSIYQDAGDYEQARKYFQMACSGGVVEGCDLLRGLK